MYIMVFSFFLTYYYHEPDQHKNKTQISVDFISANGFNKISKAKLMSEKIKFSYSNIIIELSKYLKRK